MSSNGSPHLLPYSHSISIPQPTFKLVPVRKASSSVDIQNRVSGLEGRIQNSEAITYANVQGVYEATSQLIVQQAAMCKRLDSLDGRVIKMTAPPPHYLVKEAEKNRLAQQAKIDSMQEKMTELEAFQRQMYTRMIALEEENDVLKEQLLEEQSKTALLAQKVHELEQDTVRKSSLEELHSELRRVGDVLFKMEAKMYGSQNYSLFSDEPHLWKKREKVQSNQELP